MSLMEDSAAHVNDPLTVLLMPIEALAASVVRLYAERLL